LSESRFPDLLERLVVKVSSGIVGVEFCALQAGGAGSIPATSTNFFLIAKARYNLGTTKRGEITLLVP